MYAVETKGQCEELAEALGCVNHHAGVLDWVERLQEWAQRDGIVVATSALGTGVDFGDILYILHVGVPWSMVGYSRESGRGERTGETVDAVVLVERSRADHGSQGGGYRCASSGVIYTR